MTNYTHGTAVGLVEVDDDRLVASGPAYHLEPSDGDRAGRILDVAAAYAAEYHLDRGGQHLRTLLLAVLIADANPGLTADEAIELAARDAFDPRVEAASEAADALFDRAQADEDGAA
jgi:hypothetical protein